MCDDFFLPALEGIGEKLDLSPNVVGASFMAAGSSIPILLLSVVEVNEEGGVGVEVFAR